MGDVSVPEPAPAAVPDAPDSADHPLSGWLRERVLALRASTRRRVFPPTVELVRPGATPGTAPVAAWAYDAETCDHALRVDVLVRLLTDCRCRGVPALCLIHVRPGTHEATDADLGWASAAAVGAEIADTDVPTTVAVSRWGWRDLYTGATRSWVRPRRRRSGTGAG